MIAMSLRPYDVIPPKTGNFTLNLRTSSVPANYANSEYMVWLNDVKKFFERVITSNRTLNLDVRFAPLAGSLLAQAGPGDGTVNILSFLSDIDTYTDNTARPNRSTMTFNTNYYKQPPVTDDDKRWKELFFGTALHECFHAVGVGTLWNSSGTSGSRNSGANGSYRIIECFHNVPILGDMGETWLTDFFSHNKVGNGRPNIPRYYGAYALAEYRSEMGQAGANEILIENDGMGAHTLMTNAGGNALCHWRGSTDGTPSGICNAKGQDRIDELMTTWSSRAGAGRWCGRYTIACLRDIGYSVSYAPLAIAIFDWKTV